MSPHTAQPNCLTAGLRPDKGPVRLGRTGSEGRFFRPEIFCPAPKRSSPNGLFGYARAVPNPGLSQLFLLSDGPEEKPDPIGMKEK
jgi:hypothetical protein